DAVTWDFMHWPWKQNHDGLQLTTLIAGDLSKGPGGSNENTFVASDYIPEAHYRGELAESWELKNDPLRLEFKLRKNVFWPAKEGVMERRPLVAADVVTSFQEMWKSERRIPTYWDFIKEWEAVDDHTVVAHLNQYHSNWGYRIGWGFWSGILPKEWFALDPAKRADWRNATGSGPYKVANVQQSRQQVYDKNEGYWDTETINGKEYKLPLNDRVIYHIMKDESSAIAALTSGKIDIMEAIRWQFVDQLKKAAPQLQFRSGVASQGTYIALRTDKPPFNDVRVRRAMNIAVNQKEILASVLNGEGELLNYPFSVRWAGLYQPLSELSPAAQELFEYDVDKAKKLLAEAGYPKGFSFDLMVCSCAPYHMDVAPMLQAYYQRVGVKMNIKTLEYGAFLSQMRNEDRTGGYLINNSEGNPLAVLRKSYVTGQTWNPSFYSDEKFDQMILAAQGEQDAAKRDELLRTMNRYIIEEAVPQVWLPTEMAYRAWWPWVKNYNGELRVGAMRPGPIYARVWIDQDLKKKMGY
ncbi:MAG TPA: ABC transporter substrate-binding protein, partial [Gammaproteobacteria bacterium]|nr:ABC transporter substrate-binding protein [Gammaproteobacteria bacterium]